MTSFQEVFTASDRMFVNFLNSKMLPITRFNPLQIFPQSSFLFYDWPPSHIFYALIFFVPWIAIEDPPRTTLDHFVMTGFHRLAMSDIKWLIASIYFKSRLECVHLEEQILYSVRRNDLEDDIHDVKKKPLAVSSRKFPWMHRGPGLGVMVRPLEFLRAGGTRGMTPNYNYSSVHDIGKRGDRGFTSTNWWLLAQTC